MVVAGRRPDHVGDPGARRTGRGRDGRPPPEPPQLAPGPRDARGPGRRDGRHPGRGAQARSTSTSSGRCGRSRRSRPTWRTSPGALPDRTARSPVSRRTAPRRTCRPAPPAPDRSRRRRPASRRTIVGVGAVTDPLDTRATGIIPRPAVSPARHRVRGQGEGASMVTRLRSTWLAGGGAILLVLSLSGIVAAATLVGDGGGVRRPAC